LLNPNYCIGLRTWNGEANGVDLKEFTQKEHTNLEIAVKPFIHTHQSAGVVTLLAVVWCGKQCHQVLLGEELVPIFDDLQEGDQWYRA
jgi:hypothetical protein